MVLAPLNNSVVFKKLFREPDILQVFLKDLTGLDIDVQPDRIETEKRFHPPIGNVDIVLDVVVEDPNHHIVIEIQRARYDYHYDRFLYYHQAATLELTNSYREYRLNRTVYTIVWLTTKSNDPLYQHSLITTSFRSVTESGEELPIYPHRLFFLNPFYRSDQTPAGLSDWLQLVVESIVNPQQPTLNRNREIIIRASEIISNDGITPTERRIMFEETGYEQHLRLREEQGLAEGIAKGREEGIAEGIAKGREEGREEGLAEGIAKGQREQARATARAMLAEGMPPDLILRITGLTPDELAQL